jgi:NOL1/NOP2/sun family putative RNA methylase
MTNYKIDYTPNPIFEQRMKMLLESDNEYQKYLKVCKIPAINSIRCNTLKISPEELKKKLEKKWNIKQPYKEYPEIMIIESKLLPGELGKAYEHILGYYYVQEISSMLSILVLKPDKNDVVLDLCAAPGSKTTQAAAMMENQGVLIANDVNIGRIMILSTNTQRCGVTNLVVTRSEGSQLCDKFTKNKFMFDKILVDAPCSGEGTIRSSPKTIANFSESLIKKFSSTQKRLVAHAIKCLKVGGELVYSTCTHAPEENEEVVDFILANFPMEIQEIKLPLKTRPGIDEWEGKKYNSLVKKAVRVYPHDNDTEGFFVSKFKKKGELKEK